MIPEEPVAITVGQLKKALENTSDDSLVILQISNEQIEWQADTSVVTNASIHLDVSGLCSYISPGESEDPTILRAEW